MKKARYFVLTAGIPLVLLITAKAEAQFSYNVTVESVNAYGGLGNDLTNSITNGLNFKTTLLGSTPAIFTAGNYWTDNNVYDTDFVDPDRTGHTYDSDGSEFDKYGTAISYFTGHGVCGYGSAENNCTTNSQCTSPNSLYNQSLPGFCVRGNPGAPAGMCMYEYPHELVTYSEDNRDGCTGSVGHPCAGGVSLSNGFTKWGESSASGAWAGAGTNGGVNMAVLDISCGATPPQQIIGDTLIPLFAGVHVISTIMPDRGDTANIADRGSTFASFYGVNYSSSVSQSWMYTLSSLPYNDGSQCGYGVASGDYTYGGGHGINGCGANISVSVDHNTTAASYHVNTEAWNWLTSDGNDATSGAAWWYNWVFNYNEVAYPL